MLLGMFQLSASFAKQSHYFFVRFQVRTLQIVGAQVRRAGEEAQGNTTWTNHLFVVLFSKNVLFKCSMCKGLRYADDRQDRRDRQRLPARHVRSRRLSDDLFAGAVCCVLSFMRSLFNVCTNQQKNDGSQPVKYDGAREVKDMTAWLKKNVNRKLKKAKEDL
jgi:hypothetical protein